MPAISRLTNNSDETDIASLISKDNIFSIPFFQRPYKWKSARIKQLQNDILALVEESTDFHFLGAVIVHGRRTNPSDPDVFDVIDGQQRLTTIYLLLCAVVKVLCEMDEYGEASGVFLKYVAINRNLPNSSNVRLHSCKEDRPQLNYVIRDVLSDPRLKEALGSFKFKPLPIVANTKDKGALRNNYKALLRFLREEREAGGVERVRGLYSSLLNKISVVQIDIRDPASGPTIFDSLNSRQEPMTIGDLVRNGIFARVADQEPDEIEVIDRDSWQPFYRGFEQGDRNYFDAFFFPYGLIQNPNLRKTDIYNFLQGQWTNVNDPEEIINQLREYQAPFMDLMQGSNLSGHPQELHASFKRLHSLGLPSSTLPFLMQLAKKCSNDDVYAEQCKEILDLVETFLVRRAVCGIEPTGLHAVFKGLWQDLGEEVTASAVAKQISKSKTVLWPSDEDFAQSIRERPLYNSSITPFVLTEYDKSLGGDQPSDQPWIEHVLPQEPDAGWWDIFDKTSHERFVHTLANLIPLSSEMNRELSNKLYPIKRKRYTSDSMFRSARHFAERHEVWDEASVRVRANELADWAVRRWPHRRH